MENRLKDIQEELNLKQYEMAQDYGKNPSTFSGWENDNFSIPLDELVNLSIKYNYSIDYILCLTDEDIKYKPLKELDAKLIGKNLRKLRKSIGTTQKEMAKVCSVHEQTISKYERGIYLITGYKLYLICLRYNASIDEILGREKLNPPEEK